MNGRDPVENAALLESVRDVSMILHSVDNLAGELVGCRTNDRAFQPYAWCLAFAMLARYAQAKLDDVESYFAKIEYEAVCAKVGGVSHDTAAEISHAKGGEVSHDAGALVA